VSLAIVRREPDGISGRRETVDAWQEIVQGVFGWQCVSGGDHVCRGDGLLLLGGGAKTTGAPVEDSQAPAANPVCSRAAQK